MKKRKTDARRAAVHTFFGRPEITDQLIEARGNLDLQHENVATPLTIAADRGHAAVAQLLLAEDGKQGSRTSLPLCRRASRISAGIFP